MPLLDASAGRAGRFRLFADGRPAVTRWRRRHLLVCGRTWPLGITLWITALCWVSSVSCAVR